LLLAITLSPFVEQRRWPFSIVFHEPPTQQQLAERAGPILAERDAALKERDDLVRQVAALTRQLNELAQRKTTPSAPQSPQFPVWSNDEIATRSDLWRSIQKQMNGLVLAYNFGDLQLSQWEEHRSAFGCA
jgi:hypothetical protein